METLAPPLTLKKLTEIECHTPEELNVYWLDRQALNLLADKLVALAESVARETSRSNENDEDQDKEALYKRLDYPY
ncbi:MAG: hypothetical protein LCH63_18345 [Candidatus Melainabacteria bacterium]|nr:hypothetical protein [Candidatus Melainabacteria bacterium]